MKNFKHVDSTPEFMDFRAVNPDEWKNTNQCRSEAFTEKISFSPNFFSRIF